MTHFNNNVKCISLSKYNFSDSVISQINEVLIKFFENLSILYVKLLGSIENNVERINTRKGNTIII